MFDFGIIGGGASGIYASILLAQKGYSVAIFEANDRVGKKILATGNGKCNLSNIDINENYYNTPVIKDIVKSFDLQKEMLKLGLVTKVKSGRIYPLSEQANNVLNVLLRNMSRYEVKVYTGYKVQDIVVKDFINVVCSKEVVVCKKVVFATGSNATFGVDNHSLIEKVFGESVKSKPSLAPLIAKKPEQIKGLAGVRQEANVSLYKNGECIAQEFGEVQFKKDGVSGIVMMNMCARMCWNDMDNGVCYFDFMPEYSENQVAEFLENNVTAEYGLLNKYLMQNAIKFGIKGIKKYRIDLSRCEDIKQAQVISGGIDLKLINLNSMQYKGNDKIFAIGEAVNVDGLCGGYNLHWAFASAYNLVKEFWNVTKVK